MNHKITTKMVENLIAATPARGGGRIRYRKRDWEGQGGGESGGGTRGTPARRPLGRQWLVDRGTG